MWKKIFSITLVVILAIVLGALTVHSALSPNDGNVDDNGKMAINIAKQFIIDATTFKFDGILDTIRIIDVKILESSPVQYVIAITLDSRHTGYGDRTGQQLAQVITPHTAVVKVVNGKVTSAVLDGQWNELSQEPLNSE